MEIKYSFSERNRFEMRKLSKPIKEHFPNLKQLVLNFEYYNDNDKLRKKVTIKMKSSHKAFFMYPCEYSIDCKDGGYDLTQPIFSMLRKSKESKTGSKTCEGYIDFHRKSPCWFVLKFKISAKYKL